MTTYQVRTLQVTKDSPKPIELALHSSGFVVLFEVSSAGEERKDLRDLLTPGQQRDKRRLLLQLAELHSGSTRKLELHPSFSGTIYVLDAIDGPLLGPIDLRVLFGRFPGDDQHPQPPIIQNYPPRPRLTRNTVIEPVVDAAAKLLYRAGRTIPVVKVQTDQLPAVGRDARTHGLAD